MLQQLEARCDELQELVAKTKEQLQTLQNTIGESDQEKDPLKVSPMNMFFMYRFAIPILQIPLWSQHCF